MRIHTTLDQFNLADAADKAGVWLELTGHGSRKSARAFEVHLTGDSKRWAGHAGATSYAATWDQWGVFLAAIFAVDPDASCWAYRDSSDFHYKTDWRFADGWPEDAHGDHTWQTLNVINGRGYVQACTKCSATKRSAPEKVPA